MNPWEQQPGEGERAYAAFRLYRDQPPGERSQRKVGEELGKSGALISRWSATHDWVERVTAWDREQDRAWRDSLTARRRKTVDRHLSMASLAQSKVAERLVNLDAKTLTVSEATRLLDVVARIERDALSLGQPILHHISGPDGDPIAVALASFDELPFEVRRTRVLELADGVRRRAEAAGGTVDDDE